MIRRRVPQCGDVYWVNTDPTTGHEMKGRHPFVVITPQEINSVGVSIVVPLISGGAATRSMGLTVPILGHKTLGVAVCHQVRTFDLDALETEGTASFIESLDPATISEIVARTISVIDPILSVL
jgi:mRNA interferase ChpB